MSWLKEERKLDTVSTVNTLLDGFELFVNESAITLE